MAMTVEDFAARLIEAITKVECDLYSSRTMAVDEARTLMLVKFAIIDALHPNPDGVKVSAEEFNAETERKLNSVTQAFNDKLALG